MDVQPSSTCKVWLRSCFIPNFQCVYRRHLGRTTTEQVGVLVADARVYVWQLACVYQTVSGLPCFRFKVRFVLFATLNPQLFTHCKVIP